MSIMEEGVLCQANSGAMRFQVKSRTGFAGLALCSIRPPHKELFRVLLGNSSTIQQLHNCNDISEPTNTLFIDFTLQHQEFWVTWCGSEIYVGFGDQTEPFMWHDYPRDEVDMIGYIKFTKKHVTPRTRNVHVTDWIYEEPPIDFSTNFLNLKKINNGELRWVSLNTEINHQVPVDALVAGFEKEPLYIARAEHSGSLCPGKYVHSQRKAYLPWGGREHQKTQFEILCGYNAIWVQTKGDRIPQNAFVGGRSEIRQEPLYIGRAEHEGCLINGKIHVMYKTCYLPYYGKEVEVYSFEILVIPGIHCRGTLPEAASDVSLATPLQDRVGMEAPYLF